MKPESIKEFDDAVAKFFKPLANRFEFPITKLRDGIYEITGGAFAVRIRQGTGHRKDFVVTLAPLVLLPDDLDDLSHEIGLGVVAEFNGKQLHECGDFQCDFSEAAKFTELLCVPYLLGTKNDFGEIQYFVERKIEESGIQSKKYRFPRNVREEWI
jgi:hypothetical protein